VHKQTHHDETTGLMNRKSFFAIVDNMIKDDEKGGDGYIAIIRFSNLASYNKQFGYPAGDALMRNTATLLTKLCETFPESIPARIGGVDFAAIMPLTDADTAARFGQSFSDSLDALGAELSLDNIAHIGIAHFDHSSTFGEILADADVALASAEHQGMKGYHIQSTKSEAMGNMAWKKLIREVLEKGSIQFLSQPVMTSERASLFSEVLIRIKDASGQNVSPASFAAMAERVEMHHQLDQYVIRHITHFLEQNSAWSTPLAVKIASSSITTASFSFWLQQYLEEHPQAASKLCFEITEHGAVQDVEAACHFIDLVHHHRGKVVMEHFGTRLNSFQTLRKLKVDFIKLDGSYVYEIATNTEHRAFLQTVVDIAQGLDIQVIIEHVETEEDVRNFKELGINAMQGYYFGKPEDIA
jgi:diguanylate cyclase (GGDEF)-like protein